MDQSALTTTGETPAKLTYMLEETNECCYRDVSAALMARGYSSVPFQRKMKQKKKKAQLKHGVLPSFIWAINERDIDYTELFPFQVVNHFEGISKLTTKQGLCEILRGMAWVDENDHNVCPRSYDLSQPSQRAEFSDDFRLSAASNILKHCSMKKTLRSVTVFSERVIKLSMTAITVYLAMALHGDWSGMLPFGELGALDRGDFGLLDTEWAEILRASYDLAALEPLPEWCLGEIHQRDDILLPSVTQLKIRLLLRGLQKVWPQLYINGMRNIWIVKAPVVSRGTGIRICSKLEEIFDLEKRIAGRIVQKYVETPLLVPRLSTYLNMNSNLSTQVKFDTRIWVAITCFQPLKAFIYSTIYGRKCSKAYSNGTKQLNDDLIHLTNYSVQKHSNGSASSSTHAPGSNYQNVGKDDATLPVSLVEKLRGTIATSTAAKRPSSARLDGRRSSRATDSTNGSDSAANLMLTHDELLSFLDFKCNGQGREVWEQNVWPEIRLRIASLLKASREYVKPRDKTFELLGVDVILDDRLVPWILEANMSPGLSHRNEKHNALIRDMIENLMQKVLNCQVPAGGGSPHSNVGTKLGAWEELDTTSCSNTDIERWTGIPVNIPNSKYHLISGEGKINKTWLSVLKSGSLSAFDGSSGATNSNFDDLDTYNAKSNVENLESEKTSYLKEKFNELKNSSFMQETAAASDITNKAVSSVNTMVNFKKTTPRTSVMDSRDWSQNLRSSDMDSSTSKKNRFITTSKKDLLNVVNSSSDIHGRKSNHGMTPTEKRLQQYIQNSSNLDPATLIVVGTEVSRQKIHTIDLAIRHSEKLDLLQRWSRRYLIRVRAYHRKRRVAAIFLQCLARQIIARQTVNALVRKKSAVALQSRMRSHLARLEANRRRKEKAGLLLCRKLYHFAIFRRKEKIFRSGRSKTIQRFLRMCMQVFYNKNALVIGRQAKKWVILRWRNRLIVRHMIALYFRHRVTSATVIKRSSIFKQYLNYLRTRRRRRRHLLRVLTTQAKKPSKGLRHVVKISVTYDVVVIDKGQSEDVFSPLFKYNSIQKELRNNNNSEAETFSLRNDERTDEDKNPLPHIPPASKALDLVNAMLNECEKSPHEVNTKDMSSILPNRNCTKFPEHKEDFNIVEYVARHADEPIGCRPHHPVVESVPQKKNRLQFDLSHDMIVEKKGKPEKTNSGIEIAYQEQTDDSTRKLRAEFVATDTRSSDGSGDERSTTDEDEDFLFQRDVVNPRGDMTEVDLREENISTAPSSEVVLNLELEEFCEEHQNQDSNFHNTGGRNSMIEGRLCDISGKKGKIECASNRNKLLDQPNLLQDYDLPPKIRINDSLQTGEQFYRHVSCPKNSLNVECKFVKKKCRSSKSMKKSTRTDYDGAPATSKKRNRTKEVVESQLKLAKSNAVDDPDVIYREQLERQLNLAKEKYAQRQRKRQDEALSRPSNFVREVSAPFDTKLKPSEAAWDIRNTKRGAQTKLIDAEKEEALQLAAEWNSELYELQQEQMRKRAKDYANEQARKASEDARRRNVLSNRCTESTGENGQGFATAPVEVPRRVRPKSAGNSYRDSRSFATNQQSQCHPDSSGGYLLEAYEAPIRCKEDLESGYHPDLIHSRQQAHVMTAQRSHTFQTGNNCNEKYYYFSNFRIL